MESRLSLYLHCQHELHVDRTRDTRTLTHTLHPALANTPRLPDANGILYQHSVGWLSRPKLNHDF